MYPLILTTSKSQSHRTIHFPPSSLPSFHIHHLLTIVSLIIFFCPISKICPSFFLKKTSTISRPWTCKTFVFAVVLGDFAKCQSARPSNISYVAPYLLIGRPFLFGNSGITVTEVRNRPFQNFLHLPMPDLCFNFHMCPCCWPFSFCLAPPHRWCSVLAGTQLQRLPYNCKH